MYGRDIFSVVNYTKRAKLNVYSSVSTFVIVFKNIVYYKYIFCIIIGNLEFFFLAEGK